MKHRFLGVFKHALCDIKLVNNDKKPNIKNAVLS